MNLQKKWRNIRDCFVKAHKTKEAPSGSAAKKKCPYIFYDSLLFLKDTVSVNSTTSNVTLNSETNNGDGIEEVQNIAVHSDPSWAPKRNKKNTNDDVGKELIGILNKNLETKNAEVDEDRLFFLSLVKEFKKVPEHLRMTTKLEILKVIRDSQFSNYPNTWDYPYHGHRPYTRTQMQTPVTTPSQETIVNNSILVQPPLSSADSMDTQESQGSETSYIDLFNSIQ